MVLIGICMIVLPGPAIVVIPAGLAILGIEFAWARMMLKKVRAGGDSAIMHFRKRWWSRISKRSARPVEPDYRTDSRFAAQPTRSDQRK